MENTNSKKLSTKAKIINAAYLIFIVILACNMSNEVLSSFGIMNKKIESLNFGKAIYSIPDSLTLGKYEEINLIVTRGQVDKNLKKVNDVQKIEFATRIQANLVDPTGENFKIKSISTKEQSVNKLSATSWKFLVKPVKSGNSKLILIATIKYNDRIGENSKDVIIQEKHTFIRPCWYMTIYLFFQEYWQWIIAALFLPILFKLIDLKSKSKNGS
ncbi:hypothetical protein [Flavobacterium silvaticum]|uniref:Uncharacterized protein n=1 Tax=Flavobacterium silvaticum TaxID=1852020 RepID=A0A972JHS8_9FLAO|nr:hypothetical protein [Flavobacterium silvaticum]NMH26562.1 hypothetical protein [Flavobacterium silvaticum]